MAKIEKSLVFRLAEELELEGKSVTNLAIRKANNDHGSLASISPLLKEWRESKLDNEDDDNEMPEDLILNSIQPLWRVLNKKSRVKLDKKIVELERLDELFLTETLQFSVVFDEHEHEIKLLNEVLNESNIKIESLTGELNQANLSLDKAEEDIAKLTSKIEQIGSENTSQLEVIETLNANSIKDEKVIKTQSAQITKLNNDLDTINLELTKVNTDLGNANAELNNAKADLVEVNIENKSLEKQVLTLQLKNEALDHEKELIEDKLNKSEKRVEIHKNLVSQKEIEAATLKDKVSTLNGLLESKTDEIGSLVITSEQLKRDNADLQQNLITITKFQGGVEKKSVKK